MLKDKRVDGMVYNVGTPWSLFMDVATVRPIKLLNVKPEEQKKTTEALPYLASYVLPAKTYTFQAEDNQTVTSHSNLIVKASLSDEVAYKLTKVAWEHWPEVVKAISGAGSVAARDIVDMVAPIHPGAAKYYKEIGIQLPDRLIVKK